MSEVVVRAYDSAWPLQFDELKELLWPAVGDFAISIEHVGSTSVPGLAAKPVIDMDIVIPDMSYLGKAVEGLAEIGYEHRGNLGIQDREAFRAKNPKYRHNLYVCPQDSVALKNHLCLRDALRADTKLKDEYSAIKYRLAESFPNSINDYIEGKTDFILSILRTHGHSADNLEAIRRANLAPPKR